MAVMRTLTRSVAAACAVAVVASGLLVDFAWAGPNSSTARASEQVAPSVESVAALPARCIPAELVAAPASPSPSLTSEPTDSASAPADAPERVTAPSTVGPEPTDSAPSPDASPVDSPGVSLEARDDVLSPAAGDDVEPNSGSSEAATEPESTATPAAMASPSASGVRVECADQVRELRAEPGLNMATITWSAPESGAEPTDYYVRVDDGRVFRVSDTRLDVTGLPNGIVTTVAVYAATAAGIGPAATTDVTPTSGAEGEVGGLIVKFTATAAAAVAGDPRAVPGEHRVDEVGLTADGQVADDVVKVAFSEPTDIAVAEQIAAELRADPAVEWAEPDVFVFAADAATVPNDADYAARQWNLWDTYGIGLGSGASTMTAPAEAGAGVTVAVIDTGVTSHPDLEPALVPGYDFVSDPETLAAPRSTDAGDVPFDGDYVDPSTYGDLGWDANPADPGDWRAVAPIRSSTWHGTQVAGVIAAQANNAQGIVGVAPAARIEPVRALSWRGGLLSDVAASITWASGGVVDNVPDNPNPSRVLNLSFAVQATCPVSLQTAIDDAVGRGSVVVAAAGNANADVSAFAPANCAHVISVGATGRDGKRAPYSNYGSGIDISAPGGSLVADGGVTSTSNAGAAEPTSASYAASEGTSIAAAEVSGAAARALSAAPDLAPEGVSTALTGKSLRAFADGQCDADASKSCGAGIVSLVQVATTCSTSDAGSSGSTTRIKVTATGTCDWTVPAGVTSIRYLLVGGGGGGGGDGGAGGGGGAIRDASDVSVTSGASLAISVGDGGSGGIYQGSASGSGGSTSITIGGTTYGAPGGLGGGTGPNGSAGPGGSGGNATSPGGAGGSASAGLGGVGGVGSNGPTSNITGSTSYYGGGGGGGVYADNSQLNGAAGGSGGGGRGGSSNGSNTANAGEQGTDGLGGGGGGGTADSDGTPARLNGGRGGSGVVILSYSTATAPATPGVSTEAGLKVVVDNDFALLAGDATGVGRLMYNNDYEWPAQIANAATFDVSLNAGETYLYLVAMGGGGTEDFGGYLGGVDITAVTGAQRAVDNSLAATWGYKVIQGSLSGYNNDAVAHGTYSVTLADVQTALGAATWGSAVATGAGDGIPPHYKTSGVGATHTGGSGRAWGFPDSTAVVFRYPVTSIALPPVAGDQQAKIYWSAPSSDGGSAITDYTLQYKLHGDAAWTTWPHSASTSTTATVTGLTNGQQYDFQVAAVNAAGTGSYSSTVSATPRTMPGTPTALAATSGDGQEALSWTAPASNGGATITDYTVQYKVHGAGTWSTWSHSASTSTSATVTGLTNAVLYDFQVSAKNVAGDGVPTTTVSATPQSTPSAPVSVSATRADSQVAVSWSAPSSNGGYAITDYQIEYRTGGGSWVAWSHAASTNTSATVTGLVNGTSYEFRVSGVNSLGSGTSSSASATPSTTAGAPTTVTPTLGNTQESLSWTAPVSNGGASISDYTVQYRVSAVGSTPAGSWTTWPHAASTGTTATITGLTNGTSYDFQVAAVNVAGTSSYSTAAAGTPATLAGTATGLSSVGGNMSVTVSWTQPANNGGATVTDYVLEYRTSAVGADPAGAWTTWPHGASGSTSATVTGLVNGTDYDFRVAMTNAAGTGAVSSTTSARPTPPPASAAALEPEPTVSPLPVSSRRPDPVVALAPESAAPLVSLTRPLGRGTAVLMVGGVVRDVTVSAVVQPGTSTQATTMGSTPPQILTFTSTDFTMQLASADAENNLTPLDSSMAIVLVSRQVARTRANPRGDVDNLPTVQVSGTGFQPRSDVRLFVLPNVYLGAVAVNDAGDFEGVLPVPDGLRPGDYTLQANGFSSEEQVRSISTGVHVIQARRGVAVRTERITLTFPAGSAALNAASRAALRRFVQDVRTQAITTRIDGYVQADGRNANNLSLSRERALSVARYLRSQDLRGGITARGRGIAQGVGAGARRVTVEATYALGE